MRGRRFTGSAAGGAGSVPLRAVVTVLVALGATAACQGGGADGDGRLAATSPAAPSPGYGAVFLGVDECSSFGTTSFTEVPCAGERASARVLARHDGAMSGGPACPGDTDFVLHIARQRPAPGTTGGAVVPAGYACMRNLEPPHPGDPGAGGGPRTVVGDCVYGSGTGEVHETACDGTGPREPEYRVVRAVARRAQCPAATRLYVRIGGVRPVGCARPV
ncbi:hypothetical protein [Streptomyces sp. NPDC008150]|uniref:hypothetical protein n=1 Tax=Streptomyces sp. NPDC008150 TaxID=3364816 RepID=UPI0036EE0A71